MKITTTTRFKRNKYVFAFFIAICSVIFSAKPVFSQIDYSYGIKTKGFRASLGLGGNMLETTWSTTPFGYTLVGGLSYDLNPYFSIGAEGQYGSMTGVDGTNTYRYSKDVINYTSINANIRFSIGLLSDFESKNNFTDAVKRSYIGLGMGQISSQITLTQGSTLAPVGTTVPLYTASAGTYKSTKNESNNLICINIGTNIAMPGVWGYDKVELNPNIQYNLFGATLADGYQPTPKSAAGGYVLISASLRYKF